MAVWLGMMLTNAGIKLHADVEAGLTKLNLAKVKTGSFDHTGKLDKILELTDLKEPKQVVDLLSKEVQGNDTYIHCAISNHDLKEAYLVRELGLFAETDSGTILYGIMIASVPDLLSASSENRADETIEYDIMTSISSTDKITIKQPDGSTWVNFKFLNSTMQEHNTSEQAHVNLFGKVASNLEKHNNDPSAHGGLLNKMNQAISDHRNNAELDHPEKSVKQKHLADDSVGNSQLQANSVFGDAIKNNAITPEKLSKAYVSGIDGKTGDTTLRDILYRYGENNFDFASKSGAELNALGFFASYITSEDILKKAGLPPNLIGVIYNQPYGGHTKLTFRDNQGGCSIVELDRSKKLEGLRNLWQKLLTNQNLNDAITRTNYDLRGKTGYQLATLGFCKLCCDENGTSLGYPASWTIVFNIPHNMNNGVDTKQIAVGAWDGAMWVRSVNGSNTTDSTPWENLITEKTLNNVLGGYGIKSPMDVINALDTQSLKSLGVRWLMEENGYICFGKLFGGLIIQWGNAKYLGVRQLQDVRYPIMFTKVLHIARGTLSTNMECNIYTCNGQIYTYNNTEFTIIGEGGNSSFMWMAIGI